MSIFCKKKELPMKTLYVIYIQALLFSFVSCGSGSGAAASENNSSANANSSGNIPTYSSSSIPLQSNCALAQNLPAWSGNTSLVWLQNVGNSCYASTPATIAEINNYDNALNLASWNSTTDWIIAETMSTKTFQKPKNIDSTLTLIIAGDAATLKYSFSLTLSQTIYAQPIDRAIASLPAWNGATKLVWGSMGNTNYTVPMQISNTEIANYSALLVADGWVVHSTPFENEISRYEKEYLGVVYTFTFEKESNGLIQLHMMDLY